MIDLQRDGSGYDPRHFLLLRDVAANGDGLTIKVNLGETVSAGRSRHCEWSLKRAPGYLKAGGPERDAMKGSLSWRATSRRHCRITYVSPDMVEVENLSANGTLVDGHRVDRIVLTDCRSRAHTLQLGPHGVVLELAPGALPV